MANEGWMKSFYSNPSGNCVVWVEKDGTVHLRDSKDGENGHVLVMTIDEWHVFVGKCEGLNPEPIKGSLVHPSNMPDGGLVVAGKTEAGRIASLAFTPEEISAFVEGIKDSAFVPV